MPEPVVHITLDANRTLCQRSVGELAGDTYTTDIIRATSYHVKGCPDCLAALEQPRTFAEMLTSNDRAYQQGYIEGQQKAFYDLQTWDPKTHDVRTGCPCEPCRAARIIMRKMLGGVDDGRAR